MAIRIDGKAVAAQVRAQVAQDAAALKARGVQPGMAVVLVGDDPASKIYVNNKKKACAETGIYSEEHILPAETTQEELLALIEKLNADEKIHGILVQSPLPKHLDEKLVVEHIAPRKDVDAFHAYNVGRIMIGDYTFLPCTPAGVIELIRSAGVVIEGKSCVVVGRSNIVGKPMAMLLLHCNGTVTICHSRTKNPRGNLPRGGHSCRGGRQGENDHGGYGEAGRRRDRCGHEPGRERLAVRRRGF